MPAHGTNPMFFNKKYKDWTSSTLATPPLRPITSHFILVSAMRQYLIILKVH